jgi:hypothetical protein
MGGLIHYIAYLDEFGHIGPFVSRDHPQHNTSPVFGLGGFVLPSSKVRAFATWFYLSTQVQPAALRDRPCRYPQGSPRGRGIEQFWP